MRKKENFYSIFLLFLLLSLLFWGLSSLGIFNGARAFLEKTLSPLEGGKYSFLQKIPLTFQDPRVKKLIFENSNLRTQIADRKKLEEENAALLDQFKTITPRSYNLMPAEIIGTPGFIPSIFEPSSFTLNKGTKDSVKVGLAVVFKDNLVGRISAASFYISKVELITSPLSSFTAKTQNGVLGVIKGISDKMILQNVVLSQNLNVSDIVLTYGDLAMDGTGYPANLLVGKTTSVDKNPSSLFQKAEVESLLDFSKLTTVFVIMQ